MPTVDVVPEKKWEARFSEQQERASQLDAENERLRRRLAGIEKDIVKASATAVENSELKAEIRRLGSEIGALKAALAASQALYDRAQTIVAAAGEITKAHGVLAQGFKS